MRKFAFTTLFGKQWVGVRVRTSTHRLPSVPATASDSSVTAVAKNQKVTAGAAPVYARARCVGTIAHYCPGVNKCFIVFDQDMLQPQWAETTQDEIELMFGPLVGEDSDAFLRSQLNHEHNSSNCRLCGLGEGTGPGEGTVHLKKCCECALSYHSYCMPSSMVGCVDDGSQYWRCWNCTLCECCFKSAWQVPQIGWNIKFVDSTGRAPDRPLGICGECVEKYHKQEFCAVCYKLYSSDDSPAVVAPMPLCTNSDAVKIENDTSSSSATASSGECAMNSEIHGAGPLVASSSAASVVPNIESSLPLTSDSDMMVLCNECSRWVHALCEGIDQVQYQAMTLGTHPVWGDEYLCPGCRVHINVQVVKALERVDNTFIFREAVSERLAKNYYDVIRNPMDLSTMSSKASRGQYKSIQALRQDFELMCLNALVFNAAHTEYWVEAKDYFHRSTRDIFMTLKRSTRLSAHGIEIIDLLSSNGISSAEIFGSDFPEVTKVVSMVTNDVMAPRSESSHSVKLEPSEGSIRDPDELITHIASEEMVGQEEDTPADKILVLPTVVVPPLEPASCLTCFAMTLPVDDAFCSCAVDLCLMCGSGGDKFDNWLFCWDCGEAFHSYCVDAPWVTMSAQSKLEWRCTNCKICESCGLATDEDSHNLVYCEDCDKSFHIGCLSPVMSAVPQGSWYCANCIDCSDCCGASHMSRSWGETRKQCRLCQLAVIEAAAANQRRLQEELVAQAWEAGLCVVCSMSCHDSNDEYHKPGPKNDSQLTIYITCSRCNKRTHAHCMPNHNEFMLSNHFREYYMCTSCTPLLAASSECVSHVGSGADAFELLSTIASIQRMRKLHKEEILVPQRLALCSKQAESVNRRMHLMMGLLKWACNRASWFTTSPDVVASMVTMQNFASLPPHVLIEKPLWMHDRASRFLALWRLRHRNPAFGRNFDMGLSKSGKPLNIVVLLKLVTCAASFLQYTTLEMRNEVDYSYRINEDLSPVVADMINRIPLTNAMIKKAEVVRLKSSSAQALLPSATSSASAPSSANAPIVLPVAGEDNQDVISSLGEVEVARLSCNSYTVSIQKLLKTLLYPSFAKVADVLQPGRMEQLGEQDWVDWIPGGHFPNKNHELLTAHNCGVSGSSIATEQTPIAPALVVSSRSKRNIVAISHPDSKLEPSGKKSAVDTSAQALSAAADAAKARPKLEQCKSVNLYSGNAGTVETGYFSSKAASQEAQSICDTSMHAVSAMSAPAAIEYTLSKYPWEMPSIIRRFVEVCEQEEARFNEERNRLQEVLEQLAMQQRQEQEHQQVEQHVQEQEGEEQQMNNMQCDDAVVEAQTVSPSSANIIEHNHEIAQPPVSVNSVALDTTCNLGTTASSSVVQIVEGEDFSTLPATDALEARNNVKDVEMLEMAPSNCEMNVQVCLSSSFSSSLLPVNSSLLYPSMGWVSAEHDNDLSCAAITCCLCGASTVDIVLGRMMMFSDGAACHVNCIRWAPEIVEKQRVLINATSARHRGMKTTCALCKEKGAVIGCAVKSCKRSFHVKCGLACQCTMMEAKQDLANVNETHDIYTVTVCPEHYALASKSLLTRGWKGGMVRRCMLFDGNLDSTSESLADQLSVRRSDRAARCGALVIHNIGTPRIDYLKFHTMHHIFTHKFRSSRIFWSMTRAMTRTVYIFEILCEADVPNVDVNAIIDSQKASMLRSVLTDIQDKLAQSIDFLSNDRLSKHSQAFLNAMHVPALSGVSRAKDEVSQSSKVAPVFRVTVADDPDFVLYTRTVEEAYAQVLAAVRQCNESRKSDAIVHRKSFVTYGLNPYQFFGIALPFVRQAVEKMQESVAAMLPTGLHEQYLPSYQLPTDEDVRRVQQAKMSTKLPAKPSLHGCARADALAVRVVRAGGVRVTRILSKTTEDPVRPVDGDLIVDDEEVDERRRDLERLYQRMAADYLYDPNAKLEVKKSHIHGWGLFTKRSYEKNDMIVEYIGERIRQTIADRREMKYEEEGVGSCYLFRLDREDIVDATRTGGMARFMNHCCAPNAYARIIKTDEQDDFKKHIVIIAARAIQQGEEITYDYKFPIEDVKLVCYCGAPQCSGHMN